MKLMTERMDDHVTFEMASPSRHLQCYVLFAYVGRKGPLDQEEGLIDRS